MSYLTFYCKDKLTFTYAIANDRILIGRSHQCDIALPTTDISRVHCIVENRKDGYLLTNRSKNGTFVNGEPVNRVLLKDGATVTFGSCRTVFHHYTDTNKREQITQKQLNPLGNRPAELKESRRPSTSYRGKTSSREGRLGGMIGSSQAMQEVYQTLKKFSKYSTPTLITGESGTGKELVARAIHDQSSRHKKPFIPINCAAVASELFESELFGHERGAFSSATDQTDGAFIAADGGTLFLDEIGELKMNLQAKLLRVLESGEVRRVGSTKFTRPDVRIIAATNRHLGGMVSEKSFRDDLLYRLSILTIHLPPLRDRLDDLLPLCEHLLSHHQDAEISDEAIEALLCHHWPGNVRELRNVLERAYVMNGPILRAKHLQLNPWQMQSTPPTIPRKKIARGRIEEALNRNEGNRTHAAKELGIPRSTLLYKIKQWELTV